jgi:hypothetical protein
VEDDFLDEIIAESTKRNPDFPRLVDDAYQRRVAARSSKSTSTWMVIRVELISGIGRDFDPPPGRDFLVSSQHTFRAFADAINSAFARWERSHLHAFRVGERTIGTRIEDLDLEDDQRTKLGEHAEGSEFIYEFDFGDSWEHRCSVIDEDVEPDDLYGERPSRPVPVFGWGDIPDQHGRKAPEE